MGGGNGIRQEVREQKVGEQEVKGEDIEEVHVKV